MNHYDYLTEILQYPHPDDHRELFEREPYTFKNREVKPIAFYLPQYHSIPENDQWWGKGFTEWTNVTKATPQFTGHYQPHLPGELGYYNLLNDNILERQVELAKKYAVYGFCFHFYMFDNRKRILEQPLDKFLNNKSLQFPFCLCYANENWTRRWDGSDRDILLQQSYGPDFARDLAQELKKYLLDERYIRIDNKPLVIIYRLDLLPDWQTFATRFRQICLETGIGEIYLCSVLFPGAVNAIEFGFDDNIEFPLHQTVHENITKTQEIISDQYQGTVISYPRIVRTEIAKALPFPRFRGVMPNWDNEARKPGKGFTTHGSTPSLYQAWLQHCCNRTLTERPENKRFVFINAWNEWAEGAHLEPDRRYGYAYLEATLQAIEHQQDRVDISKIDFNDHNNQKVAARRTGSFPDLSYMQVYWYNDNATEENSIKQYFTNDKQSHFSFDISDIQNFDYLRLDIADFANEADVRRVQLTDDKGNLYSLAPCWTNSSHREGCSYTFLHQDPSIVFYLKDLQLSGLKRLDVEASISVISNAEVWNVALEIIGNQNKGILDLTQQKKEMEQSYSWRITRPLRKLVAALARIGIIRKR